MDELWQRYRSFWMPVLIGLGVFLIGLIAVHAMTDDPGTVQRAVQSAANKVKKITAPTDAQKRAATRNGATFRPRVTDWAARLDQAGEMDPLEIGVERALQAALLRGFTPEKLRGVLDSPESSASVRALERFEGDATFASRALTNYETMRTQRINALKTQDPNVSFGRLLSDVLNLFRLRANRADVELPSDTLGFAGVTSFTRPSLPQRVLNLAMVSEIADIAIRSGVRSIDNVGVDARPDVEAAETFVREWPVRMEMTGDMLALQPVLDYLTDSRHPVPLAQLVMTQPSRRAGAAQSGLIKLFFEGASTLVRPDVTLQLDQE